MADGGDGEDAGMLNDVWNVYFHDPANADWTYASYVRVGSVSSVAEFWELQALLGGRYRAGMFFVMREHVFPCWDDAHNIEGGCLSIKVLKENMDAFWETLCVRLLGETLVRDRGRWACVNGVSTSPKRSFCIVKIWLRDNSTVDPAAFGIPPRAHGDVLYKSNRELMESSQSRGGGR